MPSPFVKLAAATLVTVTTLSTALLYNASVRKSDFQGGKKVPLSCTCGQFKGEVALPARADQHAGLHMSCHCTDCVLWATKAVTTGALDDTDGDEVLMVHKGTVSVQTPQLVRCTRLYPNSTTHRFMTTCCHTSIGACISGSSICGLSGCIVKDKTALTARLAPERMLIRLGDRKYREKRFKEDLNAYKGTPPIVLGRYLRFMLQGVWEMAAPLPFPEDSAKEEVLFPNGSPRSETKA